MLESRESGCLPKQLLAVNIILSCSDGFIAAAAFIQLVRIHSRDLQQRFVRQKVFHLLIGSSNIGYFIYFVLTLVGACERWIALSRSFTFILVALPRILFLAAFFLFLSFWIDLCHPLDDDDDDDERESLLIENSQKPGKALRRICGVRNRRQRIVAVVAAAAVVLMVVASVLMGAETGARPSVTARVYEDALSVAAILLGLAFSYYGIHLFVKMRRVRSETTSSEVRKVAGLSIVSLTCFTASALVGLTTNVPLLYHWHQWQLTITASASAILFSYYFLGCTVPSAYLLWAMRDILLPVSRDAEEVTTVGASAIQHQSAVVPQRVQWTTITTSQVSRGSPI